MFDKFGEFDSFEEINEKADEMFNDATVDSGEIMELARENGIPEEYVSAYLEGDLPFMCDAASAAVGKIEMEREELAIEGLMEDWISYIEAECQENEDLAIAVRRRGKTLKGCIAELVFHSLLNQKAVDKDIMEIVEKRVKEENINLKKETGMDPGWLKYTKAGFPGMGRAKKLIRKYYLGR